MFLDFGTIAAFKSTLSQDSTNVSKLKQIKLKETFINNFLIE